MLKHLDLLGYRAKDLVTGFSGVVTSVGFDLYGCIQLVLTPPMIEGKKAAGEWFDVHRVKITSTKPVMVVPDFTNNVYIGEGRKGAADKPLP